MKIDNNSKKSMTVGASSVCIQDINLENTKAVISILRDKIYTDKPKAALTETLCNAIDEHRKYNVKRPVDVILTGKNLIIRDYAKGLDEEGVTKVFFQYMNSTKSGNDIDIGGYGIGAKAPSSYTSTWYVISYHGGKKTTYMSVIDGDVGKTYKMLEQECDANNTGICVIIPLEGEDDWERGREINNFGKLAYDLKSMIGFNSAHNEMNCYFFPQGSTVMDYDDFEGLGDIDLSNGINTFTGRWGKPTQIKQLTEQKTCDYAGFKTYSIQDDILIIRSVSYGNRSIFKSDFFSGPRFWAYDGDICYNIKLSKEVRDKYRLDRTGCVFFFFFKRGEMQIAPTREDISMSARVNAIIEEKLDKLNTELNDKLSDKFEAFLKEKHTVYRAYNKVKDLVDFDFSEYGSVRNISKYPAVSSFAYNKAVAPKNGCSVVNCSVEENETDKSWTVSSTYVRRYSTWGGYDIGTDDECVFLIMESESKQKHKAYYKAEWCKALIERRKQLGLPFCKTVNVVMVETQAIYDTHINTIFGSHTADKNLLRKDVDWFNVDDIAGMIPKRTVVRTKKTTNAANKVVSKKIVTDIWNDYKTYEEADLEGKKVLGILASDLVADISFWKKFKTKVFNNGYKDFRPVFTWLTGFDMVVKVYKDDVKFWTSKGVEMCEAFDDDKRKSWIIDGIKRNKIAMIPSLLYPLRFLDNADHIKNKLGDMLDLNSGSAASPSGCSFDMYAVQNFIEFFSPNIINDWRAKQSKNVRDTINNIAKADKEKLFEAVYNQCTGTSMSDIYRFSDILGSNLRIEVEDILRERLRKSCEEARPVFEGLVKKLEFQLN